MEDVVIVGGGIAGLATSLGLHRLGIKSVVLESGDSLRTTGFALGIWSNGWRALDAIGIGEILRQKHIKLNGVVTTSAISRDDTSELAFNSQGSVDVRCVVRKVLLQTLENELPRDTIRYSSKVVHIQNQNQGCFKSVHLQDGTILKAKVVIGCDGVNSTVAKHLGFSNPCSTGRSAVRGFTYFEDGHGFEPKLMQFFGKNVRYGLIPCDHHVVYWFFTFSPTPQEKEIVVEDTRKLKELVLGRVGSACDKVKRVFESTELDNMVCSPLRFRRPWELLWGNITKDNVCVLGDALHPMTPDLAQGGCCALEDSVILARLLGAAFKVEQEQQQLSRIKESLQIFASQRKWRSFDLITTSYMVGLMQQSDGVVMQFLRDKLMPKFMAGLLLKKASFDCGLLHIS